MRQSSLRTAAGLWLVLAACLVLGAVQEVLSQEDAGKKEPMVAKSCIKCHADYKGKPDFIAGSFVSKSNKAKTLQVKVGPKNWFIKFTDETDIGEEPKLTTSIPVSVEFRREGEDFIATRVRAMPPIEIPAAQQIGTAELKKLVDQGPEKAGYMLVDSRPEQRWEEAHIPTSIAIPFDQMEAMKDRLPKDKNTLIIFYCGGVHCTLSPMAMTLAETWGYTNLKVYQQGEPGWADAAHVRLTTRDYLTKRKGYYVLIDTRGVEAATKGHLPDAVAVPADKLESVEAQLPTDRKVPIVLYGEGPDFEALDPAMETLAMMGYERVYVLQGGYLGWVEAGNKVIAGDPATEIHFVPKPLPGAVSSDEFAYFLERQPESIQIVDVRTPQEAAEGKLPNAINIPVDELKARLNELPKDKEIITHCATGMRAEMAKTILEDAGFKARFLNDTIDIIGKKVYLGTTVTMEGLDESTGQVPDRIEVATPDSELCKRLIRFGQNSFDRGRYLEAKELFWKAIMADPTSELAWRSYDRSVIFALAERAEQDPGCIGVPGGPVVEPADNGLMPKEEAGC